MKEGKNTLGLFTLRFLLGLFRNCCGHQINVFRYSIIKDKIITISRRLKAWVIYVTVIFYLRSYWLWQFCYYTFCKHCSCWTGLLMEDHGFPVGFLLALLSVVNITNFEGIT